MRVKYLAGAYRAANGDHNRAVHYYASGYYEVAKRQRLEHGRHAEAGARRDAAANAQQVPGQVAAKEAGRQRRTATLTLVRTPSRRACAG